MRSHIDYIEQALDTLSSNGGVDENFSIFAKTMVFGLRAVVYFRTRSYADQALYNAMRSLEEMQSVPVSFLSLTSLLPGLMEVFACYNDYERLCEACRLLEYHSSGSPYVRSALPRARELLNQAKASHSSPSTLQRKLTAPQTIILSPNHSQSPNLTYPPTNHHPTPITTVTATKTHPNTHHPSMAPISQPVVHSLSAPPAYIPPPYSQHSTFNTGTDTSSVNTTPQSTSFYSCSDENEYSPTTVIEGTALVEGVGYSPVGRPDLYSDFWISEEPFSATDNRFEDLDTAPHSQELFSLDGQLS